MPNGPKWCSCEPDQLIWVEFDDEYVAFHRPSGQTHFLNAASRRLLYDILQVPRDLAHIADNFASDDIDGYPAGYREELQALLDRLELLGLVERV